VKVKIRLKNVNLMLNYLRRAYPVAQRG